jgi:hypothetical protein
MLWIISTCILFPLLCFALFYLIRFAKIILVVERDLSEALELLEKTEGQIKETISLPVFFDSPEVRASYLGIIDHLKLTHAAFSSMVLRFTERSKNKFVTIEQDEPELDDFLEKLRKEQLDHMGREGIEL